MEIGTVFATHCPRVVDDAPQRSIPQRPGLARHHRAGEGVIMERFGIDAVEAFQLLTRVSQQSNIKLIEIARALIESEHPLKHRAH